MEKYLVSIFGHLMGLTYEVLSLEKELKGHGNLRPAQVIQSAFISSILAGVLSSILTDAETSH